MTHSRGASSRAVRREVGAAVDPGRDGVLDRDLLVPEDGGPLCRVRALPEDHQGGRLMNDERRDLEDHVQTCSMCCWTEPACYQLARVTLRRPADSAGRFARAAAIMLCREWQGKQVAGDDALELMERAAGKVAAAMARGGADVPDNLAGALTMVYAAGAAQMVEASTAAAEHAQQATAGATQH